MTAAVISTGVEILYRYELALQLRRHDHVRIGVEIVLSFQDKLLSFQYFLIVHTHPVANPRAGSTHRAAKET
jgi:hypothetical protein